jgi:hypothetical protein
MKSLTEENLAAVHPGKWNSSYLYDCEFFCNVTWEGPGDLRLQYDLDLGGDGAERWEKDLSDVRPIGESAVIGIDAPYHYRVIVIRRPHGAIRLQSKDDQLTEDELKKAASAVASHFALIDDYFEPKR